MASSTNGVTAPTGNQDNQFAEIQGKGKGAAQDTEMKDNHTEDDDDDDDDDEEGEEAEVVEEGDEDNMEEITLDNVIGRRTRGKVIDFAKAAQENPPDHDDEDSEDDEDFQVEDSRMDED